MLSRADLDRLCCAQTISPVFPWAGGDPAAIEGHLKYACATVRRKTHTLSRIEWGHYGSGYASFIDAWFYRSGEAFRSAQPPAFGEGYCGLSILLSRLSPYFAFMEGEQHWHAYGGSRGMPHRDRADRFSRAAVRQLAEEVTPLLESMGFLHAPRDFLASPLPAGIRPATALGEPPFTLFDALFYWED